MKKKQYITNKKERPILSDVLPYELPVTFSNRYFYNFLIENNIIYCENSISWNKGDNALKEIIKLLFNLKKLDYIESESLSNIIFKEKYKKEIVKTIPFGFKISHNEKDFRELTLIHPCNQVQLTNFYYKYKYLIIYYCNISNFSIRKPYKIAKFTYYRDKAHFENFAHEHEHMSVEVFDKEYENLKTYFVYKEISNIYKFYESYKYHRCEKKYDYLYKFDIFKCFDSIYTHSLSWALLNKDIIKDNIPKSNKTFGGEFDRLMQNLNYGETNGIVIGPEFSRIFSELILQKIDKNVENILLNQKNPWLYKRDYEIFRYVDDIFVFYNNDLCLNDVLNHYRLQLKDYNLYINDKKSVFYPKPIITGISRAKLLISDLLNKQLSFKKNEANQDLSDEKHSFYFSSNSAITKFKSIIKETEINYNDIQNYTLACIERKIQYLIKIYSEIDDKIKFERKITNIFLEILDFSFFIYTTSPKVNSTIKLCMSISKISKFVRIKNNFNQDNKHLILKKIYDEIFLVLKKYECSEHTQVETLYLLIALKELGREYRIDEKVLCRHYGIDLKNKNCANHLNYFSIVVILFYIGNINRYSMTKNILKKYIINKIESIHFDNRIKNTEFILLFFDLIVCPYLDRNFKNKIFLLFGIPMSSGRLKSNIINKQEFWFTKWKDFDFGKELDAKRSQEVY